MFPENVVQATFLRIQTKASQPKKSQTKVKSEIQPGAANSQSGSSGGSTGGGIQQHWVKKKTENVMGMNILGW